MVTKIDSSLGKIFFEESSPNFGHKIVPIPSKSRLVSHLRNSPFPHCKFSATPLRIWVKGWETEAFLAPGYAAGIAEMIFILQTYFAGGYLEMDVNRELYGSFALNKT